MASRSGDGAGAVGHAGGAGHARGLDDVLDHERHAVQRAEPLAPGDGLVGGAGLGARGVAQLDHRVERRVDLGDPREVGLDDVGGGRLALADRAGEPDGGEAGQRVHRARTMDRIGGRYPSSSRICSNREASSMCSRATGGPAGGA